MELRVWVDGVQRIVCGVRLTTTCQEIVFVLAKATHQAGRFTMIERWRNNERLLSPNEQPLVTLQRWGDHMNEVEFILKKASSDIQQPSQVSQQQPQQQRPLQLPNNTNHMPNNTTINNQAQQQLVSSSSNMRSSPMSPMQSARNQQQFIEHQISENLYQHNLVNNLNRRSQTSLGPLTSSNSAVGIGTNYPHQQVQKTSALHPMSMRNSLSATTLLNLPKPLGAPSTNNSQVTGRYAEEQLLNSSPSSLYGPLHNGYPTRSEATPQQHFSNHFQADQQQQQAAKNQPFEELYSTINKKRISNPPIVPAKPRVVVPMTSMTNHSSYPPPIHPVNNAQANFYNGSRNSPSQIFHSNLRPRHPPGYSDYLEALASRNSIGHSKVTNSAYIQHNQLQHGNNLNATNSHQSNNPALSYTDNRFYDQANDLSPGNYCNSNQDEINDRISHKSVRSRLGDTGLVINHGSAVNVKLPSNNISNQSLTQDDTLQHRSIASRSVSEVGHDMLKMIEEQKRVLLNQKNELERLDNDRDYWETKQSSEEVELVNRIENEIHQLEELWRENQAQITKLEHQDLEKEVEDLKGEQVRIESEINKQKQELVRCEERINSCKEQIEELESELSTYLGSSSISNPRSITNEAEGTSASVVISATNENDDNPIDSTENKSNGTSTIISDNNCVKEGGSSDEEDDHEDGSEGDYSDDLNLAMSELKSRAAKDVAYVDKRGLISGIRSLKLDKCRALSSKQSENRRLSKNSIAETSSSNSQNSKENISTSSNNNNVNNGCLETNGQYSTKTATSGNQYEFTLMTL